jgi:predicted ATP-dependent protease
MLIDDYRKGWALRYLREAVDEVKIAKKDSRAFNLIFDAVRKAQAAIYYSLGEPVFIDSIVQEALEKSLPAESPVLRFLVEIEKTIKQLEQMEGEPQISRLSDLAIKESADRIVSIASKIVGLLISED